MVCLLSAVLVVGSAGAAGQARAEDPPVEALLASLVSRAAERWWALERHLDDRALPGAAAPLVAKLIADSRDDAIVHGVEPIPDAIRAEIAEHVPTETLDAVRWCAACGGELSLQRNTFRLGLAPAITLGHVIVFAERDDALTDPALWVHELKHVMQFAKWGIDGFAARYVEDYAAVEHEAAEFRWEWVRETGWLERRKAAMR